MTKYSDFPNTHFSINKGSDRIEFELCYDELIDIDDLDFHVTIKHHHSNRSIYSESTWNFGLGQLEFFCNQLKDVYAKLEGKAILETFCHDTLTVSMDSGQSGLSVIIEDGSNREDSSLVKVVLNIDQSYLPAIIDQISSMIPKKRFW